MPKPKKDHIKHSRSLRKFIPLLFVPLVIALCFATFTILPHRTILDAKFIGPSEAIELDDEAYNQALSSKESFVILIDNEACTTTRKMRQMMQEFPDDLQFKYYRILWPKAIKTNLHQYIKYYPSLAIINRGKVTAWLRADADEDAIYYNDTSALQDWLRQRITINK